MTLAIFDLDNTLIGGDSDTSWGDYLCEKGYVDAEEHASKHAQFYQDYMDGTLDIMVFLTFQLHILGKHDRATLEAWRADYIETLVTPLLLPKAQALVDQHRDQGHQLLIITATNRFITEPIAQLFGIDELIATEPEVIAGEYTGKVAGVPSFAEGKVTRLDQWLKDREETLEGSYFYSDSRNDIPLLEQVTHPVAVDPDDYLRDHAKTAGWEIISLR